MMVKKQLTTGQKIFMASGWLVAALIVISMVCLQISMSPPTHNLAMKIQPTDGNESYGIELDGSDISSARHYGSDEQSYAVEVRFNTESEKLLQEFTTDNIGNEVGIYIDGELQNSCTITEPIKDGRLVISGLDEDTAKNLTYYINDSIYQE